MDTTLQPMTPQQLLDTPIMLSSNQLIKLRQKTWFKGYITGVVVMATVGMLSDIYLETRKQRQLKNKDGEDN